MFQVTKRTLTAMAVIAAVAAPSAAYARPNLDTGPAPASSGQTQTPISPLVLAAQSAETLRWDANLGPRENANSITAAAAIKKQAKQIAAAKAAPRVKTAPVFAASFHWGDAAIGAAGMLLLLSGAGVATMASHRQHHRATAS